MTLFVQKIHSIDQNAIRRFLLSKFREFLGIQSSIQQAQFDVAYDVYNGNYDNSVNPLMNRNIVARLTDIVQSGRVAGEISSYNYKTQADLPGREPAAATFKELVKNLSAEGVAYTDVLATLERTGTHPVFTAHPTSVFNMKRVAAHRDGKSSLLSLSDNASDDLVFETLATYFNDLLQNPLVKGKQTVHEEVDTALYHEENLWNAIPNIYASVNNALSQYYPEHEAKNLKLALNASSWVMGDKDGNSEIDEQTTLDALKKHRDKGQLLIRDSFNAIVKKLDYPTDPAIEALQSLLSNSLEDNGRKLEMLDQDNIQAALNTFLENPLYLAAHENMLTLSRQLDAFGTHMGKIEYRENSSVLMQALNYILEKAGYDTDLSDNGKETLFKDLLQQPKNERLTDAIIATLDNDGDSSDGYEAFQQTFGRFEVALLNPEIVENHVIAEAQQNYHILGVEVIKKAVCEKLSTQGQQTSPYTMRTTPLYESPADLKQLPDRMHRLLENATYKGLLAEQKQELALDELKQVFKVAMSDTMRRGSLIGARIAIHQCIKETFKVMEAHGIMQDVDFGGSYTDSLRDGCKPQSFKSRLYELSSGILKGTVQGIDAVHFFNGSATGGTTEEIITGMMKRAFNQHDTLETRLEDQIDSLLYETLDDVVDYYQAEYFENPKTNDLLELLDVNDITAAGNTSSRAKGRKDKTTIQSTRSITFSEAHQHNGLVPGYLAASKFQEKIMTLINQKMESDDALGRCLKQIKATTQTLNFLRPKR